LQPSNAIFKIHIRLLSFQEDKKEIEVLHIT